LISRGLSDERVLAALGAVPRHEFVSKQLAAEAYRDYPLPIGDGQTISQPYMVALMTACLKLTGTEKVLEVGTGSGYQAAILAELTREVYTVERFPSLAERARGVLDTLGYTNVRVTVGDGTAGWKEGAPYDAIIVTAGAPVVPQSLVDQLADGGRLVIPVGGRFSQVLTVVSRKGRQLVSDEVCGCVFVPLIGKEGWGGGDDA